MKLRDEAGARRFEQYVEGLVSVIGHADRVGPLHDYCTGLVLPGERKSVERIKSLSVAEPTRKLGWTDADWYGVFRHSRDAAASVRSASW